MNQRVLVLIAVVVIVLGGGVYAYRQLTAATEEPEGPVYATAPVVRGDISVGVDASGPLQPADGGGIQAPGGWGPSGPIPGPSTYVIKEVLVKEGDAVKPGQVLVRLSSTELEQQIKSKREKLDSDRLSLARMLGVSPDQLDSAQPGRGITLRVPIDGRVAGLSVKEGQELKQGQIVARIVDDSRFRVLAKLVPLEFEDVSVDMRVLLKFPQFDGFTEARVVSVNPDPVPEDISTLHDTTGSGGEGAPQGYVFVYWVTIEGNNAGLIRPGMLAQVGVPLMTTTTTATGKTVTYETVSFFRYYAEVESYGSEEQVLSPADAIATRVFAHDMQRVKAGDPIIALTGDDAQRALNDLMEKVRQEETELRQLSDLLNGTEVRATMEGIVANIEAKPGMTVQAGQWFGSVFNTSNMRMWVEVDDIDVIQVRQGSPVKVTVDALPGRTFEGTVEYVSMMGKDESGIARFQVTIRVSGTPELRPGMQANAHIEAGSAQGVLLIPLEAIFEEDGQAKVEILLPDGLTKVVPIELGLMNDRIAEVKSGLEEEQLVITGSTADLLPSQTIKSENLLPGGNSSSGGSGPK